MAFNKLTQIKLTMTPRASTTQGWTRGFRWPSFLPENPVKRRRFITIQMTEEFSIVPARTKMPDTDT